MLQNIATIAGLLVSCGTLVIMLYTLSKFLDRPNMLQDERIGEQEKKLTGLELRVTSMETRLSEGSEHFKRLDESTSITQSALVTIMDSLVVLVPEDQEVQKAKLIKQRDALVDYLVNKR